MVTVPTDAANRIFRILASSNPGDGGPGGDPGHGAAGGAGGDGVSHNICGGGDKGSTGKPGVAGAKGAVGDHRGLAGRIIINGAG